ncbi:hypothetical protein GOP47_0017795 [Adiantum capillus-veneris]|uniref:Secreted protein n=1 Tax=Adiantum capillus-veneris TaxID=13818 RepID=A0A9D4ZAX2_ADICA|nr:hypothetical protein GOP47_0017795 [Adiantum capillus-veneris]
MGTRQAKRRLATLCLCPWPTLLLMKATQHIHAYVRWEKHIDDPAHILPTGNNVGRRSPLKPGKDSFSSLIALTAEKSKLFPSDTELGRFEKPFGQNL